MIPFLLGIQKKQETFVETISPQHTKLLLAKLLVDYLENKSSLQKMLCLVDYFCSDANRKDQLLNTVLTILFYISYQRENGMKDLLTEKIITKTCTTLLLKLVEEITP